MASYSSISEAYNNNPLKQQMDRLEKINDRNNHKNALTQSVVNYQHENGLIPPHSANKIEHFGNNEENENDKSYLNHPFFTAQGDINGTEDDTNIHNVETNNGTRLTDLKKKERKEKKHKYNEYFSDTDTMSTGPTLYTNTGSLGFGSLASLGSIPSLDNFSSDNDESLLTVRTKNKSRHDNVIHSHEYYIYRFLRELKKDDLNSLMGSELDDVYDHVKMCKFCKMKINENLTKNITNNDNDEDYQSNEKYKKETNEIITKKPSTKSELKEIAVIIVIGIFVIVLLDVFNKIYKAISKKKE